MDDATVLKTVKDQLQTCITDDQENRDAALDDLRFIAVENAQWPDDIRNDRASTNRPCITVNKMPTFLDQVVGDQRQNRPSLKVYPVDNKGDKNIAAILNGWIRNVVHISAGEAIIDHAFEHAVASGYGAWRVVTRYNSDDSFEQDAYMEKIDNALAVYWGPHKQYDCSDAHYCIIVWDMPRSDYKAVYGEDGMPFNTADSQFVEGWCSESTIRVAEYYVKEPVKKTICLLSDGRVVDKKDLKDTDTIARERVADSYKIMWYLLTGNEVKDKKEWVGRKYIPVIQVWGKELNVAGKRIVRGLVRNAKDPQRMYNYWNCLHTETPIPTPTGWTTMGELQVGSKVFDETGKICNVVGVSKVHTQNKCFRITFDDGSTIIADDGHLWTVEERGKRKAQTYEWMTKTIRTDELDPKAHTIPVVQPLKLRKVNLPISPYALGVWLGDGSSLEPHFTQSVADMPELSTHLEQTGCALGPIYKSTTTARRTILGVRKKFTELSLLANKHIPAQYLRASESQRLELLQGLMDTDGSVSDTGQCSFTTTSKELSDGFAELLRSLGIKAVSCVRDRRGQSYASDKIANEPRKIYSRKIAYQFSFTAYADLPVFKLSRKLNKLGLAQEQRRRTKRHRIVSIVLVPSVPVKCVQVDSKSKLYLAGIGMVPTHNTIDTETIALAPKAPFILTPKQIDGHKDMWESANKTNRAYLLVNPDPRAPGWPQRQLPVQASSAMTQKILQADQDIRDTMGLQKASLGMTSNERSGKAILERKKEGDTGTFAFFDNLVRSMEYMGRVLIDIAPRILDTQRVIRLGLETGEIKTEAINVPAGDGVVLNDMTIGKYDVVAKVGPSFTTQRTEARQSMGEFIQYVPAAAPLIGDIYADSMDWPRADEVAKRLQLLLPPNVQAEIAQKEAVDSGEGQPPPDPRLAQPQPPPPSPKDMADLTKAQIDIEIQKLKVEQEKEKLAGMRLDNVVKASQATVPTTTQVRAMPSQGE